MSKKDRLKLGEKSISERMRIMSALPSPIQHTSLIATDITDHNYWLEKVYHGMLHEADVIERCCRRFKKTFDPVEFIVF